MPHQERAFLTAGQLEAVAAAIDPRYGCWVYVCGYAGLRWDEAAALRRKRVNLLRGRLDIAGGVTEVRGRIAFGVTKTGQRRQVAISRFLVALLEEHLDEHVDPHPDALVFTPPEGGVLRTHFRRRIWYSALDKAGVERVGIHALRHTAASLLVAAGAHPQAIQRHLGHASIQTTLNIYGHLMPDEQDKVASALDDLRADTACPTDVPDDGDEAEG